MNLNKPYRDYMDYQEKIYYLHWVNKVGPIVALIARRIKVNKTTAKAKLIKYKLMEVKNGKAQTQPQSHRSLSTL